MRMENKITDKKKLTLNRLCQGVFVFVERSLELNEKVLPIGHEAVLCDCHHGCGSKKCHFPHCDDKVKPVPSFLDHPQSDLMHPPECERRAITDKILPPTEGDQYQT